MRHLLSAAILLFASSVACGTAQAPEKLIIDGKEMPLMSTPLESHPTASVPPGEAMSTGLWRGYVASWTIKDGKLLLVKIEQDHGFDLKTSSIIWREVPLDKVFPKAKGPIHADWHSGILRVPQGKQLAYVHMGFLSVYEKDLLFLVEKGVVKRSVELSNVKADPFRSDDDRRWEALGDPDSPVKDAGDWIDGRLLPTSVGAAAIKAGKPIKTRGRLVHMREEEKPLEGKKEKEILVLYIAHTQNTRPTSLYIANESDIKLEPGSRVELEGVVTQTGGRLTMRVQSQRELKAGERTQAASFPDVVKTMKLEKEIGWPQEE